MNGIEKIDMDITPQGPLTPEAKRLERDANEIVLACQSIERIRTSDDVEMVNVQISICNRFIEQAEAVFTPIKRAIDASKKVVLDQEKAVIGPVKAEKEHLRSLQAEFGEWQRREREVAEKLRIEAIRKAQLEAEEQARREREEAAQAAADLRAEGDDVLASQIEQAIPSFKPAAIDQSLLAPAELQKIETPNLSFREKLSVVIVDETLIPRKWLKPDLAAMEEFTRKVGKEMATSLIPGIEVKVDLIPVNRRS